MKILKFTAEWCPACRHMSNIIFEFTKEQKQYFKEVDVDTDEGDDLSTKYGIRSIPTLIVLDSEGNEIDRQTGSRTKAHLEEIINKYKDENTNDN